MRKISTIKQIETAIRGAIKSSAGISFIEALDPGMTDRIVAESVTRLRRVKNRSNSALSSELYEDKKVNYEGNSYRFTFRGESASYSSLTSKRSVVFALDLWLEQKVNETSERIKLSLECEFVRDAMTITPYTRYHLTGAGKLPVSQLEALPGQNLGDLFDTPLTRRPEIASRVVNGAHQNDMQFLKMLTLTLEPQ